ncbi:MAG: hypothetical protein HYZ00_13010 [Candidatus Hydrogenedentes bacterium]|nr:hypothetical protein [Candidatus Hydrogenedentota bacterium]
MRTFLDMVISGNAHPKDIDEFVDRWHEGRESGTLAEALGMSEDEYALWVQKSDALGLIIEARAAGMRLEKLTTPAIPA